MKFKFFKKIKFPTIILVSSALIIFLSLSMIYLFGKIGADYIQINKYKSDSNDELLGNEEQYYFKKAEKIIDPFITRNPDFDRLLAGPIIGNNDPTMGDREARVTIVFYSDFDCSYCQIQEQLINKNMEEADLLDIAGIPFMYINTQEIMGQIDFETLDQMITHELSK